MLKTDTWVHWPTPGLCLPSILYIHIYILAIFVCSGLMLREIWSDNRRHNYQHCVSLHLLKKLYNPSNPLSTQQNSCTSDGGDEWPEASLIIPDFTIFVWGSSGDYVFLKPHSSYLAFMFILIGVPKAEWEVKIYVDGEERIWQQKSIAWTAV